jgi:hypothetical protein
MLRFPNPGSDISAFVRTYQSLFMALNQQPGFSLDDISKALIESNLATSSGHIGQEALKRSTRPDRTLDHNCISVHYLSHTTYFPQASAS